ncbi:MAG TPA: endonuclease/exonuclease/phosphatase family protein [Clostridia bacterium]|nr:endonuclease/exonuclease/phosphatase family protein [Clostridia bacterium]
MMPNGMIRIVTYNIHKCRGLDQRVVPSRVADAIRQTGADIVAMQEVVRVHDCVAEHDQLAFIAGQLGMKDFCFGENRKILTGVYGNATASRLKIVHSQNYDLSHSIRERRGCLRTDVRLPNGRLLHLLNVHLGTGFMERRAQARLMLSPEVLLAPDMQGPRIILGDFNEWTRGLATKMLGANFASAELTPRQWRVRSYPGFAPVLHLDHVYYDGQLKLKRFYMHRSRTALIASDHLPLIAEFEM